METIFYKATRPSGRDFRTGTVDYAGHLTGGQPLPPKPVQPNGLYALCSDQVYHASEVPSQTLIGGSWPCRLFEVTGKPVTMPTEDRKLGFTTLTVIREIEAWRALGPNGEQVAALIEQASRLTTSQVNELCATWNATWYAARHAAWYAARHAAWYATWHAARHAAWYAAREAAWYAAREAAWEAAREAAGRAAIALVVRDLIGPEEFQILAGPWLSVMGEPTLGGQS